MFIIEAYGRACLWLLVVCSAAAGAEIGLPADGSLRTTTTPETMTLIRDIDVSLQEGRPNADKDISTTSTSSNSTSPSTLGPVPTAAINTLRQEITKDGNITFIRFICPKLLPLLSSSLDPTSFNILNSNDSVLITPLSNNNTLSSDTKPNNDLGDFQNPNLFLNSEAKVDFGALEFDRNEEVTLETEGCQRVVVGGGVPNWVERLSLTTSEGSIVLQKGWAQGADNLKKLWLRISEGLIIDASAQNGEAKVEVNLTADEDDQNGIQKLCSVLPPTLELIDASHTPLKLLYLEEHCSSRLRRLEVSHSSLTSVALCTPNLVTLHLSWNSIQGTIDWITCKGGLAGVEYLQANRNLLSEVSTCGWMGLRTLDVRRNAITSLDLSTCSSSNLTSVTASHNQLVTPPILPDALLELDLSHNRLESLPMITSTLMSADFSHNNIFEVGKSRFKRARKLLHLNLAYNHITHLKEHALTGLRELRTLDISHNKLREIAGASLLSLRRLQELHLHHNHLTTLDARDLAALTHAHATLHHNPWMCVCHLLSALQRLQHCPECQHQTVAIECRERRSWVAATSVLRTCMQAVQEVTQRLNDESDEDLSEEDGYDERGNSASETNAVIAVPFLLILVICGAIVAMSCRYYHSHKRTIRARLHPFCSVCGLCSVCGCSSAAVNNNDLNHHGQLSQNDDDDDDSDSETAL